MKRQITLLILACCISFVASLNCLNYTNEDGTCADKCAPPLITSVADKKCIKLDSCTSNLDITTLQCVAKCPTNFSAITKDCVTYKICVPCFFQDDQGNCFDRCPLPLISDAVSMKCIQQVSDCQGYFIQQQSVCVSTCPYRMVASKVENTNVCVPCEQLNQCASVDLNSCKDKLSSDKMTCGQQCPPLEIPSAAVQGQNYIQCQKCGSANKFVSTDGTTCLAACGAAQLIDQQSMRCIEQIQCDKFVIAGDDQLQYCIPQCPSDQAPVVVANQKYQSCTKCAAKQVFDPITMACADTCTITQTTSDGKINCLRSIFECKGFISSDLKSCLPACGAKDLLRPADLPGQFYCIASCATGEFQILNVKENVQMCVKLCPGDTFADTDKKICSKLDQCANYLSMDGKQCLAQCPTGQLPNTDGPQKKCKNCPGKISSDGKTCAKDCAATELFDVDTAKCITSDSCIGKLINTTDKTCSQNCKPGQLLQTASDKTQKCINPTDCTGVISKDGRNCVEACQANEITVTKDKVKLCIVCPLGLSDDKLSCKTTCANFFDADTRQCVDTCTKLKSVDNKICSTKCIPPQVNTSGNTTQCFDQCDAGQIFSQDQGCIDKAACTTYISSNGASCIPSCMAVMEAESSDATNKVCVRCSDTQIPIIVLVGGIQKVQCVDKSSSASDAKQHAQAINDAFNGIPKLNNDQKGQIKDQIKKLSTDVETGIKDTKANAALATADQKQQIKALIDNLKTVAKMFQDKIQDTNADLSSSPDDNNLALLSQEYNLIAEKKKFGFAFLTQFIADDFKQTLNAPSLQVDVTHQDPTTAALSITNINSLQVTNVATNPYCSDDQVCGSSGLFSVQSTSSARRVLQTNNQQTYQTTFSTTADKIAQTICVSYDSNGVMSLAVSTSADKTTNKITCTFYDNASLYYDSTCQYIDPTICTAKNTFNQTTTEISSSSKLIVSLFTLLLLIFV